MIYMVPSVTGSLRERLDELKDLRGRLERQAGEPVRWMGSLRRQVRAASAASSTSIEGFSVTPAEAVELVDRQVTGPGEDENRQAVACYARAMDHVGTMAADPAFRWLDRVILDLHFDACWFQRDKDPGLWRPDPIGVTGADGSLEYRGPVAEEVPALMAEVIAWLASGEPEDEVIVRAAMAHLNVISVHPFRDGNGRVSRIIQSLVLALEGTRAPELLSIEEFLGAHTQDYYAALREVQGGSYQPQRDATSWVTFCVEAHISQAHQRLGQIKSAAARWERLEKLVAARRWPERLMIALEQSLTGRTDRARYCAEADVSPATASADVRRLLDAGLLERRGMGRGTSYVASGQLRQVADDQPGRSR
ncbi:MAG TPA: Fic family protein [Solirubrobacterales bacterium]|nr:Fic family protein [Solirubrobacterales bacterium]